MMIRNYLCTRRQRYKAKLNFYKIWQSFFVSKITSLQLYQTKSMEEWVGNWFEGELATVTSPNQRKGELDWRSMTKSNCI